jgi:hypothetical protein
MIHCIDRHDRLVAFDPAFRVFATANGVPDLCDRARGRPLWDHIAGSETNDIFRALVARARGGTEVTIDTRCDSPHLARYVEITIRPLPRDWVGFWSRLTRAEFRVSAETNAAATDGLLRMCAWCFRFESDGWHDIEDVVARDRLLERDALPQITHGICPACMNARMAELATS